MESRQLLTTTALFIPETGELNIELGSSDNVRVLSQNGNVRVEQEGANGTFTQINSVGTLSSSLVQLITVVGGDDANTIDLNGVTAATFPLLTLIDVDAGNGHDTIIGSPDIADSLNGGHGDDTILGQGGNDTIIGNDGNDSIVAGTGNDSVRGGDGQDFISGDAGNDTIDSGDGSDTVVSGDGDDSVFGGNGQDSITGDAGNDTLNGDGGLDTLHGGDGNDSMLGGELSDLLFGDAGDDTLLGQSGNDTLIGVTGFDQADGGNGNDVIQSALDTPVDDPVPAVAPAVPDLLVPAPLADVRDSALGTDTGLTSHTIGTGIGDGSLTVQVTSTGAFGNGSFPALTSAGAPYDPLGTVRAGDTTFDSEVYFRTNTTSNTTVGTRATLESLATNRTTIRGTTTEANSAFDIGSLHFALTQFAEPVLDAVTGLQIGSLLSQSYVITNTGVAASDFELARYFDGDLRFDGTRIDGGGRLVSAAGDEFLFETDSGGLGAATNFVAITSKGGTIPTANRFEIADVPALQMGLVNGRALNGTIVHDTNGDQSIDTDSNISLSLRNTFSLAAGASATYSTHTLVGTGTPNNVLLNQKPVAAPDSGRVLQDRDVAIDVVSNDFDADGVLDYLSIEITKQPLNGIAIPLADGRILYRPNTGFTGTNSFAYTIADNLGARSVPVVVSVTILAADTIGDALNGGLGNDTMNGSDGNDTIRGGSGQDSLLGGQGDDLVQGQGGDDTVIGGGDNDRLEGGDGNDLEINNLPIVAVSDVNVTEGDNGTTVVLFTVTLSRPALEPVTVKFVTVDGTAKAVGNDYLAANGKIEFAVGESTKTVSVTINGDAVTEYNETFQLRLSDAINAAIGTVPATATIVNDDGPVLQAGANVNISKLPFNQAEVTLSVNPCNALNLIASANNLDNNATNDLTWSSQDGGLTWTQSVVPNAPALPPNATSTTVVSAAGDPTLTYDRTGIAYFAHLAFVTTFTTATGVITRQDLRNEVVRSFDGGQTWINPTALVSPPPPPMAPMNFNTDVDKEFLAAGPDRTNPSVDRIYLTYHQNNIQFIQSSLDGVNWSPAVRVQDQVSAPGINAQPAVGPNGEVYVCWQEIDPTTPGQSRIMLDVSLNGGLTWGVDRAIYTSTVAAFNDPVPGAVPARVRQYTVPAAPDRGIGAFLAIEVDRSGGASSGNIYVAIVDQADLDGDALTNHDNTDVFLLRSVNGAASFSSPILVSDDPGNNSQFVPWLDVDQHSGNVAMGWYDTRNDLGEGSATDTDSIPNTDVEFFVTTSADGGQSFAPGAKLSAGSSNQSRAEPYPLGFNNFDYGEYVGVAVLNGTVYGAWSDNSNSTGDNPGGNSTQDLYFASATLVQPNTAPTLATATLLIVDGNDTIFGNAGNDTVLGGSLADVINGGAGEDFLAGLGGDDSIVGGAGADQLFGGDGNDTLDGQGGNDTLEGGFGDDVDLFTLGDGNDFVSNVGGLDVVQVNGDKTANLIAVGQVNNRLVVSQGVSSITADSTIQYVVVNALGGNDTVTISDLNTVSGGVLTVNGGDGNDVLNAFGAHLGNMRMRLNGNAGNDTVNGSLSGETLDGGTGDDSMCGWAGNDTMFGSDGDDSLGGSLGNDLLDGGDGADLLNGQQGDDSVLGNLGNDTLKGEDGNDTLSGGAGDDNLNGMIGNDSVLGGVGKDALAGGAGNDTLDGGRNDDTIGGSSGDDLIRGDHGHDLINAGDGSNTVIGGDGNDTIISGSGNDFVSGGDGNDKINTDNGDDVIVGGDGNDTINAGGGQDIVLGGDGNDVINGQGGTDTLAGNQGVDFITDPLAEIDEAFVLSSQLLAAFLRV